MEPVVIPSTEETTSPVEPPPECDGFKEWEEEVLQATSQAVEQPEEPQPSASPAILTAVVLAALMLGVVLWHLQSAQGKPAPSSSWFAPSPIQADIPDGETP